MNTDLKQRLLGIQKILMAHHEASQRLPSAVTGTEREILVREFLNRVFPMPYRFGSGAVVDAQEMASGQLDIVVEFPFFASFPPPGGGERLYLAESVACVAEVKSDLAKQWDQVESTTGKVRPVRRHWLGHVQLGEGSELQQVGPAESRIPVIAIGFKGWSTIDSLYDHLNKTDAAKRPDCALIIESGHYVSYKGDKFTAEEGFFQFCADLTYLMRNILTAQPRLNDYV